MKTFEELGISPALLQAIRELGFENPMPVQEAVIPLLLADRTDIVALAQTGTGKTAAFGLPIIEQVDITNKKPQALILCPTRELCLQIAGDLNDFSKYVADLKVLPVYGGSNIESQINALKKGVHIVVATPGRLQDLINRGAIKLGEVSKVVLDEADEMLNMGFQESIDNILQEVPEDRNTLLFSATMPKEIANIAKNYMTNPKEVTIGHKNVANENVKHSYYIVQARDKYLALKRIADYNPNVYGIIFCRTRKETQEIADKLIQDGYNADSLHGDLSQTQRDYVMQKFRLRNIQLLVATDVAARGLDVDDLTHIINYGLPEDAEVYTHRSGRTGRAGKTGISISIINLKEKGKIKDIEKKINRPFEKANIPNGREICERQLFSMVDKMERVDIADDEIDSYLPVIYRKLEWLSKEEVIKRFVSLQFNRFLDYYRNAPELSLPDEKGERSRDKDDRKKGSRKAEKGFTRMFINIGKIDGLYPNHIIEMINDCMPKDRINIGRIDLMKTFSFFEVESGSADRLIKELKRLSYNGRKVSVEVAQDSNDDKDKKPKKGSGKKGGSGRRSYR
ncbi:MAG: DEAD/DEAH box helicase [Prevotellaceae bacterium]|jgi:ATP-dependent RNA helicase DeaD|nr:DEAD/DEAH box helicase [Prevotellaceae bacterium]